MTVDFEVHDRVAVLTLNRPQAMNAINQAVNDRLVELWREIGASRDIWAAVITGAGDEAFCAGADLKEARQLYEQLTPLERRQRSEDRPGVGGLTRNLWVGKPVIAAVNGHCLGGGLELALACDLRVAARNASFGMTESRWGLSPNAGGTQRLPRLIPFGVALEMLLTARTIDAKRAHQVGLVNAVVDTGRALEAALELAGAICRNAPLAVRVIKEAAWRGLDLPLEAGLRLESHLGEPLRTTEDVREGVRAFAEKRKPEFKGD